MISLHDMIALISNKKSIHKKMIHKNEKLNFLQDHGINDKDKFLNFAQKIMKDCTNGVLYLHSKNIVHRFTFLFIKGY